MTKNKGGREVRKPKQPKKPKVAPVSPMGLQLEKAVKRTK